MAVAAALQSSLLRRGAAADASGSVKWRSHSDRSPVVSPHAATQEPRLKHPLQEAGLDPDKLSEAIKVRRCCARRACHSRPSTPRGRMTWLPPVSRPLRASLSGVRYASSASRVPACIQTCIFAATIGPKASLWQRHRFYVRVGCYICSGSTCRGLGCAASAVSRDVSHGPQEVKGDTKITSQNPEGTSEALSKYARDLTAAAAEGKLDPVPLPAHTINPHPLAGRGGEGWMRGSFSVFIGVASFLSTSVSFL